MEQTTKTDNTKRAAFRFDHQSPYAIHTMSRVVSCRNLAWDPVVVLEVVETKDARAVPVGTRWTANRTTSAWIVDQIRAV